MSSVEPEDQHRTLPFQIHTKIHLSNTSIWRMSFVRGGKSLNDAIPSSAMYQSAHTTNTKLRLQRRRKFSICANSFASSCSLAPFLLFAFFQMILIVKDIAEWEHLHSTTNKKKVHMLYHTSRSSWFIHETQKRICWYCSTNSGAEAHITAISDNRWKSKWIRQDLTRFACTRTHANHIHTWNNMLMLMCKKKW